MKTIAPEMKRIIDGADAGAARQSGAAARKRADQQAELSDRDDAGSTLGPEDLEDDDNPTQREELRSKYMDLINSVKQNREEMLDLSKNKISEVLDEANKLFKDVRHTSEAVLDSQLVRSAADVILEKANKLCSEGSDFDTSVVIEHLLTAMGATRLEDGEDETARVLPPGARGRMAERVQGCFKTAPTFHYMLGSFHAEPPAPKTPVERKEKKAPGKESERVMPTQVKKMEATHEEATEKEVERILGYLKAYSKDDPTPISYYEFVIDPNSFSRTVENIFHTSFLIRDGVARMYLDDDELPCIAPVEEGAAGGAPVEEGAAGGAPVEEGAAGGAPVEEGAAGGSSSPKQAIVNMSIKMWKEFIDAYDIKEPMIAPANPEDE
ncbi:non-structural maintenance of chromosomes element 4 homolog A-like [Diretmus argenteus]